MCKFFTTYKKQIEILSSRGMIIAHPHAFTNAMKRDTYYNIINGYKKYFITGTSPERYLKGTTFEQVYALYQFDQTLRSLFLDALLRIEKNLKSLIAYHFSEKYGHDHKVYLDRTNFNISTKQNKQYADNLIDRIKTEIFRSSQKNTALLHYQNTYGYIPLWVLNTVLSFGVVSNFYACMKLDDKENISRNFGISASSMNGFIAFLASRRNVCAHGGRMYTPNEKEKYRKLIPDTDYHDVLKIPQNMQKNYIYGKHDVMAMLIALKVFLRKGDFTAIKNRFMRKETCLQKVIPPVVFQNVEREMGFPNRHLSNL